MSAGLANRPVPLGSAVGPTLGFFYQHMTRTDDGLIDLIQNLRGKQAQVVPLFSSRPMVQPARRPGANGCRH